MTLHDTNLPKNTGDKFQDIEGIIDTGADRISLAKVIAKYREDISEVLNLNESEGSNDETDLLRLVNKLEDKKVNILKDKLGEDGPCHTNFTNNTDVIAFWENIISLGINDTPPHVPADPLVSPADKDALKSDIEKAINDIQFLHDDWKGDQETWQLFGGKTANIASIGKTLKNQKIKELLDVTRASQVKTKFEQFINSVTRTGGNPFHIQHTKLNDLDEKQISIRIAGYLYLVWQIINKNYLTQDLHDKIRKTLDEQIVPYEIPNIKGLHNTKVELEDLNPEYEVLRDLNAHTTTELPLGTKNLSTTVQTFQENLTSKYENGVAIGLEEYKLGENPTDWPRNAPKKTKIQDAGGTTYTALFMDAVRDTGDLFATLGNTKSIDFYIETGGNRVKIGKITLSNLPGNARIKIDIDDETTINQSFTAAGVAIPSWPLDIELPLKGIKSITGKRKASVTKLVKFKLTTGGTGPTPTPTPGTTTFNVETSISNVTEVSREEAERVAEEQIRERAENWHRYSPDRINMFFRRDYIKEKYVRKIMEGQKGLSWEDRDTNATERQQIQKSQDAIFDDEITTVDIETRCPNTYNEIDKLCKNYMGIPPKYFSTITDEDFKDKFDKIINADPPYDRPSILKLIGKQRSLTYSSNILFRMNMFTAHQRMVYNIKEYILAGTHTDDEIKSYCRAEIKKYMDTFNDLPRFLKEVGGTGGTNLDDPNFLNTLKNNVAAGTASLTAIAAQTMKLKMQIMQKGSAAYKIKQKRGFTANVGDALDSGIFKKPKKEMPLWLLETLGWARGIARTGTIMGAGILGGALFGPLGTAVAAGSTVGLRTLFSKYSHYTKEHEGQMKNEAVDLANYEAERSRLQAAVGGRRWYQTNRLWGRDRKDARHRNRYVRTTHGMSEHTTTLANNISALTNKDTELSTIETNQLKDFVSEGFARLKYYKETGQNFLGSDDVNQAEEDYKNLYAKLISGAKRLGWTDTTNPHKIDESAITSYGNYNTTMNSLKSTYKQAQKRFKGKRAALGRGNAVITGAVAGGLSYLSTKAGRKKIGEGDEHNFDIIGSEDAASPMTNTEVGGGTHSLHDIFSSAMASNPHAHGYNLIVSPEVDAIPAGGGTHNLSTLSAKIASIQSSIPPSDTKTLQAFNKAMELHPTMPPWYKRSALERAIAYASNHGADVGNQYLFGERFAETVKETLTARTSADTTDIPIDKILFGKSAANAAASAASASGTAGSLTERSMNGVLVIKGSTGIGIPMSRGTYKRHEGNIKPTSTATP